MGYSPWGHKGSDKTEQLARRARAHTHTHTHTRDRNSGGVHLEKRILNLGNATLFPQFSHRFYRSSSSKTDLKDLTQS